MVFEAELLKIHPPLSFPIGKVFQIEDTFNGPIRGTWWYRDQFSGLQGPFKYQFQAEEHLAANKTSGPWMDCYRMWWWTDSSGAHHGPYPMLGEADAAILEFENNPKETDK